MNMKTCHVCGCLVDDKELVCPECGATVVKATSGLSLKNEAPVKKKANPAGPTIGTGSGLTSILRADDDVPEDDPYHGGSIPFSMSIDIIEDEKRKKKKAAGKVVGNIIKILLIAAAAFGIYYLIVNVILKKEGATTYEEAVDIYMEAVNEQDAQKMKLIVPPYSSYPGDDAQDIVDGMKSTTFTDSKIVKVDDMTRTELDSIQEEVKLSKNKTINIRQGESLTIEFRATVNKASGSEVNKGYQVEMDFILIEDRWYLFPDTYDNSVFTY